MLGKIAFGTNINVNAFADHGLRRNSTSANGAAKAVKKKRTTKKVVASALFVIALATFIAAPSAVIVSIILSAIAIYQLSKTPTDEVEFKRKYEEIETQFQRTSRERENRYVNNEFDRLRESLSQLKQRFDALPTEEQRRIDEYKSNRRAEQLRAFLDGFQIRQFKIQHVGPTKLAMLTSYVIETAADVTNAAVQNVPGFGPVNSTPLLNWRKKLESRFVYNANPTPTDTIMIGTIKGEIAQRAEEIRKELSTGPDRLTKISAAVRANQGALDPLLQQLSDQKRQALDNLNFLKLPVPSVTVNLQPSVSSRPSPPVGTNLGGASSTSPTCPVCGIRMMLRIARRGRNRGGRFYGCSRYPTCRGTRPFP